MRIEIVNWRRFNPRTTLKSMPWMRLQTGISLERKLDDLDADQRWVWIVLLDLHAAENTEAIEDVSLAYVATRAKVAPERTAGALRHFVAKKMILVDDVAAIAEKPPQRLDNESIRDTRAAHVQHTCSTRAARVPIVVVPPADEETPHGEERPPQLLGKMPKCSTPATEVCRHVTVRNGTLRNGTKRTRTGGVGENGGSDGGCAAVPVLTFSAADLATGTRWLEHSLGQRAWGKAPAAWTAERFAHDVRRVKAKYGVNDAGLDLVLTWAFADQFWADKILSPDGVMRRKGDVTKFDNVLLGYRRHLAPGERAAAAAEAVANGTAPDPWAGTEAAQ